MCPICWATALAACSMYLGAGALMVAGKDRLTLALAAMLLTMATIHSLGWATLPWWCLGTFAILLACRIGWLIVARREQLLISFAWQHGKNAAAMRCPNRDH